MKFREKRKPLIISLKFRAHLIRAAHFPYPGSISTSRQLKSVILFLFDFLKSSCLGEKDSKTFCFGEIFFLVSKWSSLGKFLPLLNTPARFKHRLLIHKHMFVDKPRLNVAYPQKQPPPVFRLQRRGQRY